MTGDYKCTRDTSGVLIGNPSWPSFGFLVFRAIVKSAVIKLDLQTTLALNLAMITLLFVEKGGDLGCVIPHGLWPKSDRLFEWSALCPVSQLLVIPRLEVNSGLHGHSTVAGGVLFTGSRWKSFTSSLAHLLYHWLRHFTVTHPLLSSHFCLHFIFYLTFCC